MAGWVDSVSRCTLPRAEEATLPGSSSAEFKRGFLSRESNIKRRNLGVRREGGD